MGIYSKYCLVIENIKETLGANTDSKIHYFQFKSIVFLIFLSLLSSRNFIIYNPALAYSPSYELQELTNENHKWVQTYGNSDEHLKSSYTDILGVDYFSDGKILNTTFWLASGFANSSFALNSTIDNLSSKKISYGMLIDADSNTKTGYNGADYDFYVEVVAGKVSGYLYQISSTCGFRPVGSQVNFTQSNAE